MKMAQGGRYVVGERRAFRGHQPGEEFEATLEAAHEVRALLRGDIRLLERYTPTLQPGSYTLPQSWVNPTKEN